MSGLFDGTPLEQPVTCAICAQPLAGCTCPRGRDGEPVRPRDQVIRLTVEKRRKGKTVTVLTGLDLADAAMTALLKQLKSACAAGGTVSGTQLEIQGDHADRVAAILQQQGYPPPRRS